MVTQNQVSKVMSTLSQRRWGSMTPEERKAEVQKNTSTFWSKLTKEERSEMMKAVRKGKKAPCV